MSIDPSRVDDVLASLDETRRDLRQIVHELRGLPAEQRRLARKVDEVVMAVERLTARMEAVERRK
jgi:hypothetical protein